MSAQYSVDGTTWTAFSVAKTLAGAKVGLAGYHGNGQPVRFDFFRLGSGNVAPVISSATANADQGHGAAGDDVRRHGDRRRR